MFQGRSAITLDQKGRLSLPVKYRSAFIEPEGSSLTMTRHPRGCLLVFTRSAWLVKRQALLLLPMESEDWVRVFVGYATDIDIDASGRVLIPSELREPVGLTTKAMLVGMGGHLELWDEAAIKKREGEIVAAGVPESIAKFVF